MTYFEFENIKMNDLIDWLAIHALMTLNIPAEKWLERKKECLDKAKTKEIEK